MLIRRQLLYNPLAIEGRAAALVLGADSHAWLLCISSLESRLIRAVHAVRAGTAVMHVHAVMCTIHQSCLMLYLQLLQVAWTPV